MVLLYLLNENVIKTKRKQGSNFTKVFWKTLHPLCIIMEKMLNVFNAHLETVHPYLLNWVFSPLFTKQKFSGKKYFLSTKYLEKGTSVHYSNWYVLIPNVSEKIFTDSIFPIKSMQIFFFNCETESEGPTCSHSSCIVF